VDLSPHVFPSTSILRAELIQEQSPQISFFVFEIHNKTRTHRNPT
jgi:hypothetical protein